MGYTYDDQNIFAKILRGEIPSASVLETEHSLAFNDISPQAPTHVLVIPKGAYVCYDHFMNEASDAEILDFHRAVAEVIRQAGVSTDGKGEGYRLISNAGPHGNQEVPHLHFHVAGGRPLGAIIPSAR